jgi:hypothetical protein
MCVGLVQSGQHRHLVVQCTYLPLALLVVVSLTKAMQSLPLLMANVNKQTLPDLLHVTSQNQDNMVDLLHVTSQNQDNLADLLHVTSQNHLRGNM